MLCCRWLVAVPCLAGYSLCDDMSSFRCALHSPFSEMLLWTLGFSDSEVGRVTQGAATDLTQAGPSSGGVRRLLWGDRPRCRSAPSPSVSPRGERPAWAGGIACQGGPPPRVATREESGVLGFPSRPGLTPRGSLECNPEIPAFPGEEN